MGSKSRLSPSDITRLIRMKADAALNSNDTSSLTPAASRHSIVSNIPRGVTSGQYALITQFFGIRPLPREKTTIGDLTNLGAWYDASATETILNSGTAAFTWIDRSGITTSALQGGYLDPPFPFRSINALNGLSAVTLPDVRTVTRKGGVVLNSGAASDSRCGFSSNGKMTIFVVTKPPRPEGGVSIIHEFSYRTFTLGIRRDTTPPLIGVDLLGLDPGDGGTNGYTQYNVTNNMLDNPIITCITSETRSSVTPTPTGGKLFANGRFLRNLVTGTQSDVTGLRPTLNRNGATTESTFCEIIIFNDSLSTARRERVEGYLAEKWGLLGSLPSYHPYSPSFLYNLTVLPSNYDGLALWLDASDSASVTLSGATNFVTQWTDKSGKGNHAVQTRAGSRPQYQQNGIYFTSVSGGDTTLLNVSNLGLLSNVPYIGAFAVFNLLQNQPQNNNRASALFAYNGAVSPNIATQLTLANTEGHPKTGFLASTLSGPFIGGDDTNLYSLSARHLVFGEADYVTRKVRLFTDSSITSVDSTLTSTGNSPSPNASFVSIGGTGPAGENGFYNQSLNNAYIHELIVFTTAISQSQRQEIEGYLAWKWGFQASLPSNHPYFRAKP